MKVYRFFGILLLSNLIFCSLFSQDIKVLPNSFYQDGETLNYQLRYGPIIGGGVTLELKQQGSANYLTYHLVGTSLLRFSTS